MFKKEDQQVLPKTLNIIAHEETKITETDVKQAIRKLKTRIFPVGDQITNKLLQIGNNSLLQLQILK